MIERGKVQGAVIVSEFVTDGYRTWLETLRFFDYTEEEAYEAFWEHMAERGLKSP